MYRISKVVRSGIAIFAIYIVLNLFVYENRNTRYFVEYISSNTTSNLLESSNSLETQNQYSGLDKDGNEGSLVIERHLLDSITIKPSSHIDFFDFKDNPNFTRCLNTQRPESTDILQRDFKWQYFIHGFKTFYYQAVYYDNRELQLNLKVFPILGVPVGEVPVDGNVSALLWYEGIKYPVSVPVTQLKTSYRNYRYTNGTIYGNAFQEIHIPLDKNTLKHAVPHYVSFSKYECPTHISTYLPVVYPSPVSDEPKGILVCPKNLYGNMTYKAIPLMVNWFEFLKYFGVTTIHMSYSGLALQDGMIQSMFDYYIKTGFVTGFHYSPDNLFDQDVHEVDTMAFSNMNDCFYRNLNKYKYVIHQDTDEIIVPRKPQTYDEAIDEFLSGFEKNQSVKDQTGIVCQSIML